MRHFLVIFISILSIFCAFACGGDDDAQADAARLTAGEARSAIYAAAQAQDLPSLGCTASSISYRGAGVWECGKWRYDETAGRAVLVR